MIAAPHRDQPAAAALRQRARGLRPRDAEALWLELLRIHAADPEALYGLGNGAAEREDYAAAAGYFEQALASGGRHVGVLINLGIVYDQAGRLMDAERCFRSALESEPKGLAGTVNLAQNLYRQGRFTEALNYYERVESHIKGDPVAQANLGICLAYAGRFEKGERVLLRARGLSPRSQAIACDLGLVYSKQGRWAEAARVLEEAWRMSPDDLRTASLLQFARANLADWRDPSLQQFIVDAIEGGIANSGNPVDPYPTLAFSDDPAFQLMAARAWTQPLEKPGMQAPERRAADGDGKPLRIGLVSSDFTNHPVTRLLLGLIERIDATRFWLYAYSTQPHAETPLRARVRARVRALRDVHNMSPAEQAASIRKDKIDVLVDLNGFSGKLAVPTFALRPAPLQISYMYSGTLGASVYDCIVADHYCLAAAELAHYAEAPLWVDPCYMPSDPLREGGAPPPPVTREEYGLPTTARVFGAWQAHYKITGDMFAAWMQILQQVPGSVLWLRDGEAETVANLRREAMRHGIDAGRLVFTKAEPLARYLARMRLADVMLDSFPYGAHTTVNDALYTGVPVVTRIGRTFASRASASQIIAAGLPELVASSATQYIAVALELATKPSRLGEVRARLRDNASASPLFDMDRYARAFTRALETEWQRREGNDVQTGLPTGSGNS